MVAKHHCQCVVCNKKENFEDAKGITFNKWKILAWSVGKNEPIVVCDKCEYKPFSLCQVSNLPPTEEPVVEEKKKRKKKL